MKKHAVRVTVLVGFGALVLTKKLSNRSKSALAGVVRRLRRKYPDARSIEAEYVEAS